MKMSLINKVDQFNDDVDIAHQIVHGDSTTIVTTEGGPVRSLAKLIADKDAEFIGGKVVQQAVAALNATESAMNTAILARDAALVGAVTYPDEATGRAAVTDGEYFKVIGSGDVAAREYRRTNASTSVLVAEYPSGGALGNLKKRIDDQYGIVRPRGDLFQLQDPAGKVVARVSENGELYLRGITAGLQETLNLHRKSEKVDRLYCELLTKKSLDAMSYLPFSGERIAPCPLGLMPQRYIVNPAHFSNLALVAEPYKRLIIDTPYAKDDRVVHPYLIEFYGGFRGYRYWMTLTPYQGGPHENPVVYGSNDLLNFEMLTGFNQPLDLPRDNTNISDVAFAYDPTSGELTCIYRHSYKSEQLGGLEGHSIWGRTTRDGINWDSPRSIIPHDKTTGEAGWRVSPSILYNPTTKEWILWLGRSDGHVELFKSDRLYGEWSYVTRCQGVGPVWHFEVKYFGELYVMLCQERGAASNAYFATSADGTNWTRYSNLFPVPTDQIYKATMTADLNPKTSEMTLNIMWTHNNATDPNLKQRAFITKTTPLPYSEIVE